MTARGIAQDVRIYPDVAALSIAAAAWIASELAGCIRARGRASLVLSGGSTPRAVYVQLGARFANEIPWGQVHIFWGDERYVPHESPLSNYRMAKETLLSTLEVPDGNVHPMPTRFRDPDEAALDYESTVTAYSGVSPVFDIVLLGIGEDGHTASLFAGSPAMTSPRTVMAVRAPVEPSSRLTLTLPVIVAARHVGVLVAGTRKGPALADALGGVSASPAGELARRAPRAIWWVDRAASQV